MTLNSLASTPRSAIEIEQMNMDRYWEVVKRLEPEFYLLRMALRETGLNPMILPRVIRAIANMAIGTGHGKVTVFMQAGRITAVEGSERDRIEEEALLDDSEGRL